MTDEPSICRRGLDMLLERYPEHDLLAIDWQRDPLHLGPWLLVTLGKPLNNTHSIGGQQRINFAIWKRTGNVYEIDEIGAVCDDPFLVVK